jgi:hypothetical protein
MFWDVYRIIIFCSISLHSRLSFLDVKEQFLDSETKTKNQSLASVHSGTDAATFPSRDILIFLALYHMLQHPRRCIDLE